MPFNIGDKVGRVNNEFVKMVIGGPYIILGESRYPGMYKLSTDGYSDDMAITNEILLVKWTPGTAIGKISPNYNPPVTSVTPILESRNINAGSTNSISWEDIKPGDQMVNLRGPSGWESTFKRYYKKSSYDLIEPQHGVPGHPSLKLKKNPSQGNFLFPETNVRPYVAKITGGKRRSRKTKRRVRKTKRITRRR